MGDLSQTISSLLPMAGTAVGGAFGGPLGATLGGFAGKMLGGAVNGGGQQSMGQQAGNMGQMLGMGQMMQGAQDKKQANGFFPSYEDPRQTALLAEIAQKRKSLETGAAFADQIQNANQAQ